jgi:hypothetical protein
MAAKAGPAPRAAVAAVRPEAGRARRRAKRAAGTRRGRPSIGSPSGRSIAHPCAMRIVPASGCGRGGGAQQAASRRRGPPPHPRRSRHRRGRRPRRPPEHRAADPWRPWVARPVGQGRLPHDPGPLTEPRPRERFHCPAARRPVRQADLAHRARGASRGLDCVGTSFQEAHSPRKAPPDGRPPLPALRAGGEVDPVPPAAPANGGAGPQARPSGLGLPGGRRLRCPARLSPLRRPGRAPAPCSAPPSRSPRR